MVKEQFRETDLARKVAGVRFCIADPATIRQNAHLNVFTKLLYVQPQDQAVPSQGLQPIVGGPLDFKMGTSMKDAKCGTCGLTREDCVGHFGYLDLELPVFHVGYFKATITVLQCICKSCSRVLLPDAEREKYLKHVRRPGVSYLLRKALHKQVVARCKKSMRCSRCQYQNGVVKRAPNAVLKIVHVIPPPNMLDFAAAMEKNAELEQLLPKCTQELLDPLDTVELFERIPNEDLPLLMFNVFGQPDSHPLNLLMTRIPVPPPCIRPSVTSDLRSAATTNEDDITMKLVEILFLNNIIRQHRSMQAAKIGRIAEDWDYLQLQCALYIDSETSGIPSTMQSKKFCRSLTQRLKGKHGRFRGNLSGKRVDFSGRTVISPDPNLRIDQVGVPEHVAKIMTYPEHVTKANMDLMRKLIINGSETHPGANFVVESGSGAKRFLKYGNRALIASKIRVGDIVERHLRDGDIVLFNRQPSLHKISIMSHYAKVMPHRTFRFNECVCTPYNADFDGDEMNLHLPQTEEARAEAITLMGVKSNLITPRNGEPLVAAIQDFITGGYLLTYKDRFFNRSQTCQIIGQMINLQQENVRIQLPPPCIIKPLQLWSGKQILGLMIRPNRACKQLLNLTTKGKNYDLKNRDLCANDSWVVFHNGELMCGALDKATLGSGSKKNIFYILMRDFGEQAAADAMWRLARLTPYFLMNHGFSIGIGDVTPGEGLLRRKQALLDKGYTACTGYLQELKNRTLQVQPGCSEEETLESKMLQELSQIREEAGRACFKELSRHNAPLIMAVCGSKGSFINISQMIACVGQQAISGSRVADGFENRSLPHFLKGEKTPEAKGFVEDSFYSGLTPTEFFFHTMAGREGLVDTAVKTAETGYLQRRLVKGLEDLRTAYDGTVRTSTNEIVQFVYGEDGLDPSCMETDSSVMDLQHVFDHACNQYRFTDTSRSSPKELLDFSNSLLKKNLKNVSAPFMEIITSFLHEKLAAAKQYAEISEKCNPICKARSCALCAKAKRRKSVYRRTMCVSKTQIQEFVKLASEKYRAARAEPGAAVGAVGATSIGEPSTQMTLKTFHFAGVASMNITQGVPRIIELINAVKKISTPVITAHLTKDTDADFARLVKARIEKTTLGEITEFIEEVYGPGDCFLLLKISLPRVRLLKLAVNMGTIADSLCTAKNLGIKSKEIQIHSKSILTIHPSGRTDSLYYSMQNMKHAIQSVVIQGLPGVSRCVVHADEKTGKSYKLLVEGNDFRNVLATPGVDGNRSVFNSIVDVAAVLGIEAVRRVIISEILETMAGHGIGLDRRHVMLLADLMTFRGDVLGITRSGLAKMKESVIMLASFERTMDHLYDAAYYGQEDDVAGVSECIIMGVPMDVGTGAFKLLQKEETKINRDHGNRRELLFDVDARH